MKKYFYATCHAAIRLFVASALAHISVAYGWTALDVGTATVTLFAISLAVAFERSRL